LRDIPGRFPKAGPKYEICGHRLIVIGVIALAYQGFTYTTHKKVSGHCPNPGHEGRAPHCSTSSHSGRLALIGPKGRDAQAAVDAAFRAEMVSYSRARGAFAGVSLEGATLRPDNDANHRLYGKDVSALEIVTESRVAAPQAAHELDSVLEKASPHLKP
jgi:hypothetical protein